MIPQYLTITQAAGRIGVHERTILRRIKEGTLPACIITPGRSGKEYRIKESDLEDYLKGG